MMSRSGRWIIGRQVWVSVVPVPGGPASPISRITARCRRSRIQAAGFGRRSHLSTSRPERRYLFSLVPERRRGVLFDYHPELLGGGDDIMIELVARITHADGSRSFHCGCGATKDRGEVRETMWFLLEHMQTPIDQVTENRLPLRTSHLPGTRPLDLLKVSSTNWQSPRSPHHLAASGKTRHRSSSSVGLRGSSGWSQGNTWTQGRRTDQSSRRHC